MAHAPTRTRFDSECHTNHSSNAPIPIWTIPQAMKNRRFNSDETYRINSRATSLPSDATTSLNPLNQSRCQKAIDQIEILRGHNSHEDRSHDPGPDQG